MEVSQVMPSVLPQNNPAAAAPNPAGADSAGAFQQHLNAFGAAQALPADQTSPAPIPVASDRNETGQQGQKQYHRATATDAEGTNTGTFFNPLPMAQPVDISLPLAPPAGAGGAANRSFSENKNGTVAGPQSFSSRTATGPNANSQWLPVAQMPGGTATTSGSAAAVLPDASPGETQSAGAQDVTTSAQSPPDAVGKMAAQEAAVANDLSPGSNASGADSSQQPANPAATSTRTWNSAQVPDLPPPSPAVPVLKADAGVTAAVDGKADRGRRASATSTAEATAVNDLGNSTNAASTDMAGTSNLKPSRESTPSDRQSSPPLSGVNDPSQPAEKALLGKLAAQVQADAPVVDDGGDELAATAAGKAVSGRTPAGTTESLSIRLTTEGSPLLKWIPQPSTQTAVPAKSQRLETGGDSSGTAQIAPGSSSAEAGKSETRQGQNPNDFNREIAELPKSSPAGDSQPASDFEAAMVGVAKDGDSKAGDGLPSDPHAVPLPPSQVQAPASASDSGPVSNSVSETHNSPGTAGDAVWRMARQQAIPAPASGLLNQAGKTEMRVDLRSDSLGAVAVRAVLNGGELGAQIQVGSREAHAALMAEVTALERSLNSKGIHVGSLDISQGTTHGRGHSQGRFAGERGSSSGSPVLAAPPRETAADDLPAPGGHASSPELVIHRLSVLA